MPKPEDGGQSPGSHYPQGTERVGGGLSGGGRRHRPRSHWTGAAREERRAEPAVPRRYLGSSEGATPRRWRPHRAVRVPKLRGGGVGPPPRHVEGDNHQDGGQDPEGQAGQGHPPKL